ncbi:hypothetical protein BGZ99_001973 [Dissophora globulifera]|uniref:Protein kinase domain-containing protein n=1 Tax=Dissophora globulifera TaxID=979702 RepID=A0A9P6RNF7_9FUNG|nr:hypothetical protein BGZ99_001973 [Dissophora globulifera]
MEIPPHNPISPGTKVTNKAPGREVRDANAPASPQPQQNTGHHHTQHAHHASPQQQQFNKTPTAHSRRGSADRGTKDSLKTRSSTPKAALEYVGPYLLGRTLGKGSSGCVKLARHRKTNEQVAVKIISKASLVNKAAVHRGIEREIAIMKLINHPHVIRLYDVYETEKELFLVMEYVSGGELFEYLVNKGRLDEAEALRFFQQIIVGLAFCHKRKICHRDLKPENLLLDDRMNVKIADFGMASLQKTGRLLETSCGSPHYASPEVVTGLKYDGSSSDIWSCGIILYALLTGHLPFDDENIRQLLSKVKAGKFYMPTDISPGARDLINRMLTVNPKRRITMQGVMMHPWFRMVNPDRNTLGEPAEDPESSRPLLAEELDAEIILHMRWLFAPGPSHSDPEAKEVFNEEALLREIEEKMTNTEENMEKLFYRLLCQHKTELLENYSGDDNESVPDAPRRRADSFPNSAASVRSHTPDFSRASRSPRDSPMMSPGSPLSPMTKTTPAEPSPLTLNPLEAAVARAASAAKIAARTPSPSTQLSEAAVLKITATATQMEREHTLVHSAVEVKKEQEGIKGSVIVDNEMNKATKVESAATQPHVHPNVIAPKPVSPTAHRSSIVNGVDHSVQAIISSEKTAEPTSAKKSGQSVVTTPSIESQVMLTQITEATQLSQPDRRASITAVTTEINPVKTAQAATATVAEATSTNSAAHASVRPQRPILHPLDVKASAGTTAMSVCVSQHSRKYSEGTTNGQSSTPHSPSGPKRPWFARLFDFKPQPLTFKSNWSAMETQERLEAILRGLFHTSIQIEPYKKPAFGIKCRYEGGVIIDQVAKPVKFKIEVTEKAGYLTSSASSMSNNSSISSSGGCHGSNHAPPSSAAAAILATVDLHHQHHIQHHGNYSQTNLPAGGVTSGITVPDGVASRRASDGGSILSSAAAAVSTSLAAARNPFNNHHHHHGNNSTHHYPPHHHSHHLHHPSGTAAAGNPIGYPPLPQPLTVPRRIVKVTLHQQQGANSTLKMIYDRLQEVWEQQAHGFDQYQQQQKIACSSTSTTTATTMSNGSDFSLISSPLPVVQKAQRSAAI